MKLEAAMLAHSPRFLPVLAGLAIVMLTATPIHLNSQSRSEGESALLGTWQLDLAKSKYFPGPAPRGETRIYTSAPEGIRGVSKRIHADGRLETIEYLANFDNEMAVTGTPAYDAIKLRKVDEYTSESVLSHAGMVYGTARRVISVDGQTMTIAFQRRTSEDTISNLAIYHKQ
jgi:hypothetical protein